MEWYKGDALTVGQLKKALEGIPDDAEVASSMTAITGWLQKTTRVLYHDDQKILVIDDHAESGTFSDEEIRTRDLRELG